jgi:hypothetical protein
MRFCYGQDFAENDMKLGEIFAGGYDPMVIGIKLMEFEPHGVWCRQATFPHVG